MLNVWTQKTGYNLGVIYERQYVNITLPTITDVSGITFEKIAGILPAGLSLVNNTLVGVPFEVSREVTSTFVIRAYTPEDFADLTFSIITEGPNNPVWITNSGLLPVSPTNLAFVLDNSYINFQLAAIDSDLPAGDSLKYFIGENDGTLPPGLTLSQDGVISGIIDPILAIDLSAGTGFFDTNGWDSQPFDMGLSPPDGFSTFNYDSLPYDYNSSGRTPRKLNRNYEFNVSVSDGRSIVKRTFRIFVVGDDFLRTDNDITRIGSNTFTADNTYLRAPIWLTANNLGVKRANNAVTILLQVHDPVPVLGPVMYRLEPTNNDKYVGDFNSSTIYYPSQILRINGHLYTVNEDIGINGAFIPVGDLTYLTLYQDNNPSILPTGLYLDEGNGEIFGYIPYQPAITKNYTFTISAIKYDTSKNELVSVSIVIATYAPQGQQFIKIHALDENGRNAILGQTIRIGSGYYRMLEYMDDPINPSGNIKIVTLNTPLIESLPTGTSSTKTFNSSPNALSNSKASKTFSITVIGEVDSVISWKTSFNLGTLLPNYPSTLSLLAETTVPYAKLSYTITSGALPAGLILTPDGEIQGKVNQYAHDGLSGLTIFDGHTTTFDGGSMTVDRKFTFTVMAEDQFKYSAISGTFTIMVNDPDTKMYSNIYVKPMQTLAKRKLVNDFLYDYGIFDPNLLYRNGDPSFGMQYELRMLFYAGIETTAASTYIDALQTNVKKKRYTLGSPKLAYAHYQNSWNVVYEVIYVEVFDEYERGNIGVEKDFTKNNTTYYPSSTSNMRSNIHNLTIVNRQIVSENAFLPLWMVSPQDKYSVATGFIKAVPLCYCKPTKGSIILNNIINSGFDFSVIDYEIDRYIIDATTGNINDQYLKFPENNKTNI